MNEEERLRRAVARRRAERDQAVERALGKPTDRPLLELLTGADLLLVKQDELDRLCADYVARRNLELGRPLVLEVDELHVDQGALEVRLSWRNLQERGRQLTHRGSPPDVEELGHGYRQVVPVTACGIREGGPVMTLHPTDRPVTCQACLKP